jgi:hypothetical protein
VSWRWNLPTGHPFDRKEIVVVSLSTLAAIPMVATIGFFAVTGLIGI